MSEKNCQVIYFSKNDLFCWLCGKYLCPLNQIFIFFKKKKMIFLWFWLIFFIYLYFLWLWLIFLLSGSVLWNGSESGLPIWNGSKWIQIRNTEKYKYEEKNMWYLRDTYWSGTLPIIHFVHTIVIVIIVIIVIVIIVML